MFKFCISFISISFFLSSFALYGDSLKPCEIVGIENVLKYTTLSGMAPISDEDRPKIRELIEKCMHKYATCIVATDFKKHYWFNQKLQKPITPDFEALHQDLIFGILQYFDEERKVHVCSAVSNTFARAIPWFGKSWVVENNKVTEEYEYHNTLFKMYMTPSSLFKAMLSSYKFEIERDLYKKKLQDQKLNNAIQMLQEGHDPSFVKAMTGLSTSEIELLMS